MTRRMGALAGGGFWGKLVLRGLPTGLLALTVAGAGCRRSSTTPSGSQLAQGSVSLAAFQLAIVTFSGGSGGTFSSRVDWGSATNDVDSVLVRGRCTMEQILLESGTCSDAAAVTKDNTLAKPSQLSASLQAGDYTLVILNGGPAPESVTYRLEGAVSGASNAAAAPSRRTDTFTFSLPAGSNATVLIGPVRAGSGPLSVQLAFSGTFRILACVGTAGGCSPMGGVPTTANYLVPDQIPAGSVQATVYFTPGASQPAGAASGTVSFTYNPLP